MGMMAIRKIISSTAIFMLICSLIAIIVTVGWWIFPVCSESVMLMGRWIIGTAITLLLLATKTITIN